MYGLDMGYPTGEANLEPLQLKQWMIARAAKVTIVG